jgi:WhiB family transcriptional regulator, redox-sensing transcriptional regulator
MGELATMLTRCRQPATGDWRMAAACSHTDPELFFPVSSNGQSVEQMAQAKALCSGCSVRPACLQFALDTHADGVWGGTTEEERRLAMPQARRSTNSGKTSPPDPSERLRPQVGTPTMFQ